MRNESHVTLISRLAAYVDEWRKRSGMSQQTVVDEIVKAHDVIQGPAATGIRFESNPDEFNRMHANSQRVWRWLDDKSKDSNLLPANFIPSILAAMPKDLRFAFLAEQLAPIGIRLSLAESSEDDELSFDHVVDLHLETVQAVQLISLAQKEPTEANLLKAEMAAQKVTGRFARTRKVLASVKDRMLKAKGAIGKAFHRKDKVTV
ncbi:MAG: hypothetical protein ACM34A_12085 [Bacillota bacterium]